MDFTDILNKGIKKYIDKNLKKRNFGRCVKCDKFCLLIEYEKKDVLFKLCERCYSEV